MFGEGIRVFFFQASKDSGLAAKTAAQNIQPGQYKADRDFVSDTTREVSKNVDARFRKSPGSLGLPDPLGSFFCVSAI